MTSWDGFGISMALGMGSVLLVGAIGVWFNDNPIWQRLLSSIACLALGGLLVGSALMIALL